MLAQLVTQLHDPDPEVVGITIRYIQPWPLSTALTRGCSVLEEACEQTPFLQSLIKLGPALMPLGESSYNLLLR